MPLTTLEICAGAGGQALGLEKAGFTHTGLVEIDKDAIATLKENQNHNGFAPHCPILHEDITQFDPQEYQGKVDLFAGGVPCPPFSVGGKQRGREDERDLFPTALKLIENIQPRAVLLENVKGLSHKKFNSYREEMNTTLTTLGYIPHWKLLYAPDFGVPQRRYRYILVAVHKDEPGTYLWPEDKHDAPTVGECLLPLMKENNWSGAEQWAQQANAHAPTIVGGSKKHGGADLGPSGSRKTWNTLGIKATSIAETAPDEHFPIADPNNMPRLTVKMGAKLQGFPDNWIFSGKKTSQWRQVGNAFPPPVAQAVGTSIINLLQEKKS